MGSKWEGADKLDKCVQINLLNVRIHLATVTWLRHSMSVKDITILNCMWLQKFGTLF